MAAYAIVSSGGTYLLKRYACTNGGAATVVVVARNLASGSSVAVAKSGARVDVKVTERKSAQEASPYTFTVSANRRTP